MAKTRKTSPAEEIGKRPARTRKPKIEEIISINPATHEELGRVTVTLPSALDGIVGAAAEAQRRWAHVPIRERARILSRASDHILDNHSSYAEMLTKENGKTIVESYAMELVPVVDMLHILSRLGPDTLARERVPSPQLYLKHKRHYIDYTPLGVVGIITPWNYPLSTPAGEVAASLVSGNAVVLKPAPLTPLIAELLRRAFDSAGLPEGLFTVVHGDAETGSAMCRHPGIAKIFFTGSVAVGRAVATACAETMKPCVLELGGKDAAIVCADADVDRAARGIVWGGIANCGQTCAGIERVYVSRTVHDEFLDRVCELAAGLTPGDPLDPATQVGPFTDERQYDVVCAQVDDALERGAKRHTGGPIDVGLPGKWYAPAVVTDVDHSMTLMQEETFGPVIPIMPFDDERDAVTLANDSEYGLGASVWSRDVDRAKVLASSLEAGSVWINDHMYSFAAMQLPWGGAKRSGVGVTHSKFGLYENVHPRLLSVDSGKIPVAWWHPYDARLLGGLRALLRALYSPTKTERLRASLAERDEFKQLLGRVRRTGRARRR